MGWQGRGRYLYLADLIPARHRGIVLSGRGVWLCWDWATCRWGRCSSPRWQCPSPGCSMGRERHHPAVGRGYDVLAAQKWIAQNFFRAGKTIFPPQKLRISYHGRAKKAILRRKTNGETAKNKKIEKIRKKFKKVLTFRHLPAIIIDVAAATASATGFNKLGMAR